MKQGMTVLIFLTPIDPDAFKRHYEEYLRRKRDMAQADGRNGMTG
jgi:hypothetical protein